MADLNYSPMRIHQYGFTYLSNWWNYSEEEVTSAFWRAYSYPAVKFSATIPEVYSSIFLPEFLVRSDTKPPIPETWITW